MTATGGGSGYPVIFSLDTDSSGCSLSGSVVNFTGIGTCGIDANQARSTNFTAAPQAEQSFTVVRASTSSKLTLLAAPVPYGREQTVTFRVGVSPQFSGNPSGNVSIVSGTTTLCSATISNGSGSCSMPPSSATLLAAGNHAVTATYMGSPDFSPSASAPTTMTVSKSPTKTGLSLSASSVVHGHEQALKITAAVSPAYIGVPIGTVTVFAGRVKLCSINVTAAAHGKGSCSPGPSALAPGRYSVTGDFGGNSDFVSSVSVPVALKVT